MLATQGLESAVASGKFELGSLKNLKFNKKHGIGEAHTQNGALGNQTPGHNDVPGSTDKKNQDLAHQSQHSEAPERPHSSSQEATEKQQKPSEPTFEAEPESVLAKQDVDGQDGVGAQTDGRMQGEGVVDYNRNAEFFTKDPIEWNATRLKGTLLTYKVFQRNDIDWNHVRTTGDKRFIGKTNGEAAKNGLAPQLLDGNFATLHHFGQKSPGPLVEASTRYHGEGKPGQDILHSQFGKSKPHPSLQPDRKQFDVDTREYWKWRVNEEGK
ncbi:HNH/ENDO VII family nuclease [Photobacterium sp. 53610]|uniref:HNH/ENDO VII family nuclease n=1 Tax=Photobacterium sp. 53610 TaxID=3102789 RepID=UPI002EDB03C5